MLDGLFRKRGIFDEYSHTRLTCASSFSSRQFSKNMPSLSRVSVAISRSASVLACTLVSCPSPASGVAVLAAIENSRSNSVRHPGSSMERHAPRSSSLRAVSRKKFCLVEVDQSDTKHFSCSSCL